MNREDAYYFYLLRLCGISDGYDEWLSACLEGEEPISDIAVELSLCGSDAKKIISCLNCYCHEQAIDEKAVCDKLRAFLWDSYSQSRFSLDEVCSLMYLFAVRHRDIRELDMDIWGEMFYADDCYSLARSGIISMERFINALCAYLESGTRFDFPDGIE